MIRLKKQRGLNVREKRFYSRLRKQTEGIKQSEDGRSYSIYLPHAPELFATVCRLSRHGKIGENDRKSLSSAVEYFISPLDVIPEALSGVSGYIDDVALCAYTLQQIIDRNGVDLVKIYWAGTGDISELVKEILDYADTSLDRNVWQYIRSMNKD